MTETEKGKRDGGGRVDVVIGGEQILLNTAIRALLESDGRFAVHGVPISPPERFASEIRGISAVRSVGVLVDPTGEGWEETADSLRRADPHFGLVALTARPSYGKLRRWKHEIGPGLRRANALLSIGSDPTHLAEAILDAYGRPKLDSPFWLDGPKHPYAFGRTTAGRGAARVRGNARRHEILVLAGRGKPLNVIAKHMDVRQDQIREHLNSAAADLEAKGDVELGRKATENGLLDDLEDFDHAQGGP